jgi:hypothetical protein
MHEQAKTLWVGERRRRGKEVKFGSHMDGSFELEWLVLRLSIVDVVRLAILSMQPT